MWIKLFVNVERPTLYIAGHRLDFHQAAIVHTIEASIATYMLCLANLIPSLYIPPNLTQAFSNQSRHTIKQYLRIYTSPNQNGPLYQHCVSLFLNSYKIQLEHTIQPYILKQPYFSLPRYSSCEILLEQSNQVFLQPN